MPGCIDAALCPSKAGLIDEAISSVITRVQDALAVFGDYFFVGELWFGVTLLVLAAGYIAIFVPWPWLKSVLGGLVFLAASFAAGATVMFRHMRGENKEVRDRNRALEAEKRKFDNVGGWF